MKELNLSDLVANTESLDRLRTKAEWRGLVFEVRYLSKRTMRTIAEACQGLVYDPVTKTRQQKIDLDKFTPAVYGHIVTGWEGVTLRKLVQVMPLDESKLDPEQLDTEIPFTLGTLVTLVKEAKEVDDFLMGVAEDISLFRKPQTAAEVKN